jgi:steroid delta-isomerase-like uncharacterized protein
MVQEEGQDIIREIWIDAAPADVFEYFTDARKMVAWKAVSAELDPRPGGIFRIDVTGQDVARGEYLEIDPPHRVVFTWGWERGNPAAPPGSSVVEITLSPHGEGTLLRLVHRGVPDQSRAGSAKGWDHYLPRLASAATGRDPGPDPWASAATNPATNPAINQGGSRMDQERNKANLQRLYDEVMNSHRVDAADELITPDRPDHDPNLPPEFTHDREGFKKLFTMFIAAFPDLRFRTEFMVAEGDMVVAYNHVEGTHRGEFMGIPATDKSFAVTNADFCRFTHDGLIAEHWGVFDMGSMLRQLGVAG